MSLLPRSHTEFTSTDYWEKFFKKRAGKAFEWYGEYQDLCGILHKYIKPADRVLVIGCGNSRLSADLYDVGHHGIVNIDISDVAIKQMAARHVVDRPEMKFLKMDVTKMEFEDGCYSVVLDKGTLDALMPNETEETQATVNAMFAEVGRVLRVGGRYVCISLAQSHIIKKVLQYFTNEGWMIRICRVPDIQSDEAESKDFHMPVFAFVFTKFKKMPNMKQILEVAYFEDRVERFETVEQLESAVKELQHYGMIRQQLNKGSLSGGEHISLDLYSEACSTPRYTLHVVDSPKRRPNKFAIFIIPEGRETEWMFSTDEGRDELSQNAGFERLVVVTLHRAHTYGLLDTVKDELSSKVMELAPPEVGNKQVPFLSLGDEINTRMIQHRGESELSGEFVVEDVESSGGIFRRLVFLSNKNIVQSESKLIPETAKKKGSKKKSKLIADISHLSINYYSRVVAGLAFMQDFHTLMESGVNLLLVGLGGGNIPMFIHNNFTKINLEIVEIDAAMVSVATDWFGFTQDQRMRVHIADGLEHIKQLASQGAMKHLVILDADNKDTSHGMTCPPTAFLQPDILAAVNTLLDPRGVFILNIVCHSHPLRDSLVENLKAAFKCVYSHKVREDVNETIYAFPTARDGAVAISRDGKLTREISSACRILQDVVEMKRTVVKATTTAASVPKGNNLQQLSKLLEGLVLL